MQANLFRNISSRQNSNGTVARCRNDGGACGLRAFGSPRPRDPVPERDRAGGLLSSLSTLRLFLLAVDHLLLVTPYVVRAAQV